ncbi:DEKNAAC101928 [Brettanomyces naardenensis]|uniref:DEKNAAC101928 n=1 Tax=Brettanomyces naardenensis TaxID=13370 RepID=A0A448YJE5_BRENA|nr:DEKNAAC101928 [Brettanomyces naardenensis]
MVCLSKYSTALLISSGLAIAAEAPEISDNPEGAIYKAHLDSGDIKGIIEIYTARNHSAKVHLDITGLPDHDGPFYYHLHKNKVPSNGDCEATGTHFNPYDAPAENCDSNANDGLCQVGDLSGKHGFINTTCFETTYYDPYLSLTPGNKAFIGDLSVVVHFNDMSKMLCANLYESKRKFWQRDYQDENDDDRSPTSVNSSIDSASSSAVAGNFTSNHSNSTFTADVGVSTTYCDNAMRQVANGLLGTVFGLLVSFF